MIGLKPELLTRIALETGDADPSKVELLTNFSFRDAQIEQIGQLLWSERQFPGAASQLYVESMTNILAVHLLRHYCKSRQFIPSPQRFPLSKLQVAINYIHDNLGQDLTLAEIAAVCGMSRYHFARLFKQLVGLTPHQYVLQRRVERAKELLADSNLSLIEIAFCLGFTSQSHFTATFRKLTTLTPKAYRQELLIFADE